MKHYILMSQYQVNNWRIQQIHAISKLITLLSWAFDFPIYVIMSIHHWIIVEGNPIHCILKYKYLKHFNKNTIKEYKIKIKIQFCYKIQKNNYIYYFHTKYIVKILCKMFFFILYTIILSLMLNMIKNNFTI